MTKQILSIDLGTASIGWALRELCTESSTTKIASSGVVIFSEGVGREKNNEFSLASLRGEKRRIRRQYYRRKLRKYAVLRLLVQNGMAPITEGELNAWVKPAKGTPSVYPANPLFHNWLRLHCAGSALDSTCFTNIYKLRCDALHGTLDTVVAVSSFSISMLLGRVLYNYAQRRGFKSNAKNQQAMALPENGEAPPPEMGEGSKKRKATEGEDSSWMKAKCWAAFLN